MTELEELKVRVDILDGVGKAHMVILRGLLKENLELKAKLRAYAEQLETSPLAGDVSIDTLLTMRDNLLSISG